MTLRRVRQGEAAEEQGEQEQREEGGLWKEKNEDVEVDEEQEVKEDEEEWEERMEVLTRFPPFLSDHINMIFMQRIHIHVYMMYIIYIYHSSKPLSMALSASFPSSSSVPLPPHLSFTLA